ncbi:cation transporter [Bacillus cereus]
MFILYENHHQLYYPSSALRADGLNNLTDIGASLAILIGLKISRKPRDPDHPYMGIHGPNKSHHLLRPSLWQQSD